MENLRRRVPFKQSEDELEDQERILDEQEQETVVEKLRTANAHANTQYQFMIQVLLGLSMVAQIFYLFTPSKRTPLENIFPVSSPSDSPLPLSTILTLIYIGVHVNLLLLCRSPLFNLFFIELVKPLPFDLTYALSAVGPALSLFLQKPWQTTVWWCFNPLIVFITQTVVEAIEAGNNSVAELEGMRYTAPGA
ncbi:hypothetical protein EST38_g3369 [Candolleomyces aberdarensis]|uniref:Uncharacterized protein n=1 Tax=Candolleomyces aberdarensis TaxID=2316362 RepID=A0A4Q2DTA5_9AGAR|nr:hypothetical protein EST38_g3369 [Candolleomyces aberdarensis]